MFRWGHRLQRRNLSMAFIRVPLCMVVNTCVIYVVANPVRGLLDRKILEEHLQSSNESMKTRTKEKERERIFFPITGGCSEGLGAF